MAQILVREPGYRLAMMEQFYGRFLEEGLGHTVSFLAGEKELAAPLGTFDLVITHWGKDERQRDRTRDFCAKMKEKGIPVIVYTAAPFAVQREMVSAVVAKSKGSDALRAAIEGALKRN